MMAVVTIAGSPPFVQEPHWSDFQAALSQRFPLNNLHWKSPGRPALRTVQQLDIELLPVNEVPLNAHLHSPLLDNPLLHLFFISCEDPDMYRMSVKKHVTEWRAALARLDEEEWLIVLVAAPDPVSAPKKRFQAKSTILERLRADFNTGKRDRCVHLTWSPSLQDPTLWASLVSAMKDGIIFYLEGFFATREEHIRRLEGLKQTLDWDFMDFALSKDILSSSFESLNLLEDAQLQLDELETTYNQFLADRGFCPLKQFGADSLKDDSTSLLSLDKKQYRALLAERTISTFDFRTYVLSRQWRLLVRRRHFLLAAEKAGRFIPSFSKSLRLVQKSLTALFSESWTYSSSLDVIDHIQRWPDDATTDTSIGARLNGVKGALYDLSRAQLDHIGQLFGHLPSSLPEDNRAEATSQHVTNKDIITAIEDKDKFDKLYAMITNRAIECYVSAGRKRSALRLHASLATLDSHRQKLNPALSTFSSLPAHYSSNRWAVLQGHMLAQSLRLHSFMQSKDVEWLAMALDFLACTVAARMDRQGCRPLLLNNPGLKSVAPGLDQYISESVIKDLRNIELNGANSPTYLNHPIFSPKWTSLERSESPTGWHLNMSIESLLPKELVAPVIVTLHNKAGDEVSFENPEVHITPGVANYQFSSSYPSSDFYIVQEMRVRLPAFALQYTPNTISSKRLTVIPPRLASEPFQLLLRFSRSFELGSQIAALECAVMASDHRIQKLSLRLLDPSAKYNFENPGADDGCFGVTNLAPHSTVTLSVPFEGWIYGSSLTVNAVGSFILEDEPKIERQFHHEQFVSGSLPVVVNVQDIFRIDRLLWKFTISAEGKSFARIIRAGLMEGSNERDDRRPVAQNFMNELVSPSTSFAILLEARESTEGAYFWLQYRTLEEEVLGRARHYIEYESQAHQETRVALERTLLRLLREIPDWESAYANTSRIALPSEFSNNLHNDPGTIHHLDRIRKGLSKPLDPLLDLQLESNELVLPLNIPKINIIVSCRFELSPTRLIQAGQPIHCTLQLQTSIQSRPASRPTVRLRFELVGLELNSWLISGSSRREFTSQDDTTHDFPLSMIALRPGRLPLPICTVEAYDVNHSSVLFAEVYQEQAAEFLQILPRCGRSTFEVFVPPTVYSQGPS